MLISYFVWSRSNTYEKHETKIDMPAIYTEALMMDKIIELDFSNKLFKELQKHGYDLHESAGYQFISEEKQVITLSLYDIDIYDERVVHDIQNIVDRVSQEHGFLPFHAEIHVIHR